MWLSLNIISKIVDIHDISPEEIALKLTMSSAEIETIDRLNDHFKSIVTSRVLDVQPHPNAQKLTLVDLDTGSEKLKVVCGAMNHKKGDIVALAQVGTRFSDDFTVKKAKIRGIESRGMLCSERELGLSDDHSGIMILPENTAIGKPLTKVFSNWVDTRLEIDNKSITHRPDLWSHLGFAREISAIFNRKLSDPVNYSIEETLKSREKFIVTIESPEQAPRYCGLWVKNITIEDSPDWLKAAVTSIGMRPINNIVDITNYVMAEIGEPMHAFDRNKLQGNEIIVRMANDDESLRTLDGELHTLCTDDIVIADRGSAIALAGVMGGGDSEIDDETTDIILEAANFNPVTIRRTAGRYTLRTEAAIRFEKYLDPELCRTAIIRCYEFIKQIIPEAEAVTNIVDTYPKKLKKNTVITGTDFIRKRLGAQVEDKRIEEILTALDFKIHKESGSWRIEVPTYRSTRDVSIPDDIVEEVGRIFGYNNISPVPPLVPCDTPKKNEFRSFERKVKDILVRDHHLTEVKNYSFVGEDILHKLGINEDKELRLQKPLSQEQDRLRRSLIPNILKNIEFNQRYNEYFRIFELGRVFIKDDRKSGTLSDENTYISGAIFSRKADVPLFYTIKGIIIDLLGQLELKNVEFIPKIKDMPPYAHPGRCMQFTIDERVAGFMYDLHPTTMKILDIRGNASIFDVNVNILYEGEKQEKIFIELQKFPEVPFEISVIADKYFYVDDICRLIEKSSRDYIRSVDVISIYEGEQIPEGLKSVSVKIIFAAEDRTLTHDEIDKLQKDVIDILNKNGFRLR
jgi:phenylalanyl-tRNA synthetase beta chain